MENVVNETFKFNAFQFLKEAVQRGDITQEKMNIVVDATKNKSVLIEFAVHSRPAVTDAVSIIFTDGFVNAVGSAPLLSCMKGKTICSALTSEKSELSKYDYQITFMHKGSKQLVDVKIADYPIPQITEQGCEMRVSFKDSNYGSCALLFVKIYF